MLYNKDLSYNVFHGALWDDVKPQIEEITSYCKANYFKIPGYENSIAIHKSNNTAYIVDFSDFELFDSYDICAGPSMKIYSSIERYINSIEADAGDFEDYKNYLINSADYIIFKNLQKIAKDIK